MLHLIDEFPYQDDLIRLEIEVSAKMAPFCPGDSTTPPSGGHPEDLQATWTKATFFEPHTGEVCRVSVNCNQRGYVPARGNCGGHACKHCWDLQAALDHYLHRKPSLCRELERKIVDELAEAG